MHKTPTTGPALLRAAALSAFAAVALLSACGGGDKATPTALPNPAQMFSWSTQEKVAGFSHSAQLYPVQTVRGSATPLALPEADAATQGRALALRYQYGSNADGTPRSNSIDDYLQHNQVAGLLVLKNGAVVLERYRYGIGRQDLWDGKSVSKAVTSTLMGVAIRDGHIASLDDLVTRYVAELAGSAYEGVTLRQLLRMESGVAWDENYLNPLSDIRVAAKCQAGADASACLLAHLQKLPRRLDPATGTPVPPGAVFNYSTGEAHLSGLVVQRAVGQNLAQYMQARIWQPFGMESDAHWWAWNGTTFGGGGFNATLRDYGRWGLLVARNGVLPDGSSVLPEHWVRDATTWTANSAVPGYGDNGIYGYMWWLNPAYDDGVHQAAPLYADIGAPLQNTTVPTGAVPVQGRAPVQGQPGSVSDWTFAAWGIYGQMVAINQRENLVVVQLAVWDKPDPTCCDTAKASYMANNPYNEAATFLNALITALH